MPGGAAAGLEPLQAVLGHCFSQIALLEEAVSHSSLGGTAAAAHGRRGGTRDVDRRDYERLEFLGDRVLGLVVAEWLLERFPREQEGDLARRHTAQVQRAALATVARAIGLGDYLKLAPGEETAGGRDNETILADACEAVIGAVYLDGGLEPARRFIRHFWTQSIDEAAGPPVEPKTGLQEWAQARGLPLPAYSLVGRDGPDHDPRFIIKVTVDGHGEALGEGNAKRTAEKAAALALLNRLEGKTT